MIPAHFRRAIEHGVLPIDPSDQCMGLSFKLDTGEMVRLRVPVWSMRSMLAGVRCYLDPAGQASQSPSSSGKPSVDGSTTPGQSVCPPTSSSNAAGAL